MAVHLSAERRFAAPVDAVFALSVDPQRFPAAFTGLGPIPALTSILPDAPAAVGSTRQLTSADGSQLTERIVAWEPPHRHRYVLSGFAAPLAWLVRAGTAEWRLSGRDGGTDVHWTYDFELTTPLAWPLAAPLLKIFMQGAMKRCLDNLSALPEAR
jgi:uncharacterized protein YndB with AHSA1/START domain